MLALPALLGGCDMVVMNPTGDIAVQQRDLILFSTGVMLLIIVPVMVLTVVFARKYRRGNANKTYDPSFTHSTTLELVIWSCPLLIIIALSAVTWTSTHLLDPFRPLERIAPGRPVPAGTRPLEIQAVALDWKWLFIYPEQGIATVNELALPVDVPVRFSITSNDQFNTFYVPTLAGMIYAMPGMRSELNAVLNKPGTSEGYSANYSGAGYSNMRFKMHGQSPADFARWVAGVKARGGSLATDRFVALAKPSEKVPVMRFGAVQPQLFDRIVNRCVEPGKPCMMDVMARDMARAGGNPHDHRMGAGMPPGRGAAPITGEKPTPALQKAPEDKGSGPNVTKPAKPGEAPGQLKPGDQRNRDLSALPSSLRGAAGAVRA
ncbi:ubiquinol oxidase subunit II [Sphingomonas sp.]|jgi:cytochrome o ubiquinol oxidase subunit 2|uniref:ubiquinol oxidase subunit II n=2 Tax=unclassified Sphingomonas TaxID=196159 RepID=UPI000DBC0748|nr:ubiquinol oxidase subunit II [Sphingomonas sp.]PZT90342.1 MAG: ubiquinol oxidase subunit II [Sphingomonas sp.]